MQESKSMEHKMFFLYQKIYTNGLIINKMEYTSYIYKQKKRCYNYKAKDSGTWKLKEAIREFEGNYVRKRNQENMAHTNGRDREKCVLCTV